MTTSTPPRHIKKRLIKTVGAHMLCSCGYMQDGELYFHIKDYQGNVRVVLNQANQPVEVNSYYPYGGLMAATTTEGTQPYKYSTKELDRENGLDWYDSKARMYDPTIGRTPTQDPMAEKYYSLSPYLWCAGNPITFTDPNGNVVEDPNGYIERLQSYYLENCVSIQKYLSNVSTDYKTRSLLENCVKLYESKLSELNEMVASDQVYRIEYSSDVAEGCADTNYSPESGKIVTRINSSLQNSVGLVSHESEHWYQFETGELSYDFFTGDAGYLYDMTDEVKAFNIQSVVENGIRYQVFDLKQNRIPEHVTYEEQVKAASKKRNNNIYRKKINGKKITVKPNGY